MKLLALALFAVSAFGQAGPDVNQVGGPPNYPALFLPFYDGSGNLIYGCSAAPIQAATTQKRADSTLTSIGVATNVGTVTTANPHGLYIGARVAITGATVDTDLNATYVIATVPSTTTYTIATVAVADGTYTESTLVITTRAPLNTLLIWSLLVQKFNGSNQLIYSQWVPATATTGNATARNLSCTATNRATY